MFYSNVFLRVPWQRWTNQIPEFHHVTDSGVFPQLEYLVNNGQRKADRMCPLLSLPRVNYVAAKDTES